MVVGELLAALNRNGAFSSADGAISVLDIGSDDGTTLRKILSHSHATGPIKVHGVDYKSEAAKKFTRTFLTEKSRGFSINGVTATCGNAFSGQLANDLQIDPNSVDIAIASHLMYGVNGSEVETLVSDMTDNLLSPGGIGILLHIKDGPDTMVSLRNQYGDRAERDLTASSRKIRNPPEEITDAMAKKGGHIRELEYKTRLYFSKMTDREWDLIKDPANFGVLVHKQEIVDNILRIAFIALRTPQNMATDTTGRNWANLVEEVKKITRGNEQGKTSGYIEDTVCVQIVLPQRANDNLPQKADEALDAVRNKLPEITLRAETAFFSRGIV